jgi:hypothetical protein
MLHQLRVIGIQCADGPADLPHVINPVYRGRQGNQGRIGRIGVVERTMAPAGLAAVNVDGGPPGDGRQPRSHLPGRIITARRPPRLHERLLGGLLGQSPIPKDLVGHRVHQPAVCPVHGPHRVRIPGCEPGQHLRTHAPRPYALASSPRQVVTLTGLRVGLIQPVNPGRPAPEPLTARTHRSIPNGPWRVPRRPYAPHGGGVPPLTRAAAPLALPSLAIVARAPAWPSRYRSKNAVVTRATRRSTGFVPVYGVMWSTPNRSR